MAGRTTTGVPRGSDAKMRHCLSRKLHRAGLASTEVRGRALFWSRRVITLTTTTPMLVYYRPVSDLGHLQICKATHGGETGRRGGCSKNLRALRSTDPPSRGGPWSDRQRRRPGEGRVIYGGVGQGVGRQTAAP
ncbi:TPA_asm: US2.5 [Human alphaherpesvirus 1]|nr:TPA_asm: US2.5 [Human alphaherpesvirus 1]